MSLPSAHQVPLQSVTDASASLPAHSCRHVVPGDSPAYYVGDPEHDLLSIETLDLVPNPPVDNMSLKLKGILTSDIGPKPRIKLTVSLNGTVGPQVESDLCSQPKIDIMQNGTSVCPPEQGPVEMSYSVVIPYWWLKKGDYTVHVEMYASDGARMTAFEGTIWVNGEAGEGDGWF